MALFPKGTLQFLKSNRQVIYSILLILFIPLALIVSTYFAVSSLQKNMDIELQRKALLAGEILDSTLQETLDDVPDLQKKIDEVSESSKEITDLDISIPEEEDFKIIASSKKEKIGTLSVDIQNVIAWHEDKAIAYLTQLPSKEQPGELERFWIVVKPLHDPQNQKAALLHMQISSRIIDILTRQTLTRSYIILAITIGVIILLVANNARLFQYTVLFRRLKEVDQMKDEFISMASHELRTPLTGIKGYVSMILEGSFGPISRTVKKNLELVFNASKRLDELVADILDVSRIEQKRLKISLEPIDIKEAIPNIVKEFEPQAKEKDIRLIYYKPKEVLPKINTDPDRFRQVLINLVGNAIKYTFKGKVEITSIPKERMMEIKVSDTGIGMSAKAREKLFSKFYRIKTDKTAKISGTGLGLWITKELVEKMKGEIYVDSIEGVGSQFTILLPIITEKKSRA